jgi:hypothetical protein
MSEISTDSVDFTEKMLTLGNVYYTKMRIYFYNFQKLYKTGNQKVYQSREKTFDLPFLFISCQIKIKPFYRVRDENSIYFIAYIHLIT